MSITLLPELLNQGTLKSEWYLYPLIVTDTGSPQQGATAVLTLTINNALAITTTALPQAYATVLYRVAFTASAGAAPYTWRISLGTLPTGLTLTPSGVLTGIPITADAQDITIQVTDSQTRTATAPYRLLVGPAPSLLLHLTPPSSTLDPQSQHPLQLTLDSAYPSPLTGNLTLTGTQDPDATFLLDGHPALTVPFSIAAGTTAATFASTTLLLQSGTSSQPFTVTATTDTPPHVATQQYNVLPSPPKITSAQYTAIPTGFAITLTGFSTTREVQTATFRFFNNTVSTAPFTLPIADIFRSWYQSTGGGLFIYRQPFTLTGIGALTSVQVNLTNSVGTSTTLTLSPELP